MQCERLDMLRNELEKLFSLDELVDLSRGLLGFDPDRVGGTGSKASFARALVELCDELEALEALVDAVLACREEVDGRVRDLQHAVFPADESIEPGTDVGPYLVTRKIGQGDVGAVYVARVRGREVALKILRREACRDRRALHRFMVASRLCGSVEHHGLARGVLASSLPEGISCVAYDHVVGESLSARIRRTGPLSTSDAVPLLRAVLEALAALHDRRLAHGDLKPQNVIVPSEPGAAQTVLLVDAGTDRLRLRAGGFDGQWELLATLGLPTALAPERLRGQPGDERADLYSVGAVAYELLTGQPVSSAVRALDMAVDHLSVAPRAPSTVASQAGIPRGMDDWVLALLRKEPEQRPRDARTAIEALGSVGTTSVRISSAGWLSEDDLDARIEALRAAPQDQGAVESLEAAIKLGADARVVADTFVMVAGGLQGSEDRLTKEARKSLLTRAGRLYESTSDVSAAEHAYSCVLGIDPRDDRATKALAQIHKSLGKYEDLIEVLIARSESAETAVERAQAFAEIGRVCSVDVGDTAQALVAYAQAFCEDSSQAGYAEQIERLAGGDGALWGEAISVIAGAVSRPRSVESRNCIYDRLGRWYADRLARPDLAVPCFKAILATNPAHEGALTALLSIYRKAKRWQDLGALLLHAASVAPPARSRGLYAEAAELLETELHDPARARTLYQQIFQEDPTHDGAAEALARMLDKQGDWSELVKLLKTRTGSLRGEARAAALTRMAEVYEKQLRDPAEAERHYALALETDPDQVAALQGLDGILSRAGRHRDLLSVLDRELRVASTPRQKIALRERMARIYEEEFVDHAKAAEACQAILEMAPAHEGALSALARHCRALERWKDLAWVCTQHFEATSDNERRIELALARASVLEEKLGSSLHAIEAYEQVLQINPDHTVALDGIARLRERAGDTAGALALIVTLADRALTMTERAEQWMRAARVCASSGDHDGATDYLKRGLDADPKNASVWTALRSTYVQRGDAAAAAELLVRQVDTTDGDLQKARLLATLAVLAKDHLRDNDRAERAASNAIQLDPTNFKALIVLGDLAFERERFAQAAARYEPVIGRADAMAHDDAFRVLNRYVDALSNAGSAEKALGAADALLRLAPDDEVILHKVARVMFSCGNPVRAVDLYRTLLDRFGPEMDGEERADALYHVGEASRQAGRSDDAIAPLNEAADLDRTNAAPLIALAKIHEARSNPKDIVRVKMRLLEITSGSDRNDLAIEIGDLLAQLGDRAGAASMYLSVVQDCPDDRRPLTKLMALYSESQDWDSLCNVVLRLADLVQDKKQKAKYFHTVAMLSARHLGDLDTAVEHYDKAIKLDPTLDKALAELTELRMQRGEYQQVEELLKLKLDRAQETTDRAQILQIFDDLAVLYHQHLHWVTEAIDAYEAAQTLDPDNEERFDVLADLYASDPQEYLAKALKAQYALLRHNPNRRKSYKLLRRLYTAARRPDPSWCLCQALHVLRLADADETDFFQRLRPPNPASAKTALSDEDHDRLLTHPDVDPVVTCIFATIEPVILHERARSFEATGYGEHLAIDPAEQRAPVPAMLGLAARVLRIPCPPVFQNPNDPGGLYFLDTTTPSIVLGASAMRLDIDLRAAAFLAARHLSYFRSGRCVHHLIATGTGLKAWMFAAIKLVAPRFAVPPDLERAVSENLSALETSLDASAREQLTSLVSRLLQAGGAIDLKRWAVGIDLTADRSGLLIANDLEAASGVVRATEQDNAAIALADQLKELVLFSVSEEYFALRDLLGTSVAT